MKGMTEDEKTYFFNNQKTYYHNGKPLSELSDREVQELQLFYLSATSKYTDRILNNVLFFFWLFWLGVFFSILISTQN